MEKRPALGKGLRALIPDLPDTGSTPTEIDIDLLSPNAFQPRRRMNEPQLETLAASIRSSGVIQPIVVRRVEGGYQIIAGERRWRAAQLAGLTRVPVVVREVEDDRGPELLETALVENVQRENLNPIEEAEAYRRLSEDFKLSQDAIARAVGKDRTSVANYLRLLRLPVEVQAEVAEGRLSMGHARALLALPDEPAQRRTSREVITRRLSVRETESLIRKALAPEPGGGASRSESSEDVHTRAAAEQLKLALGTPVRIVRRGRRGTIQIAFISEDELQRLYELLTGDR